MVFVEYLCARQCAKCFACMIMFGPHHDLMRLAPLSGLLVETDVKSLNDLPKAAQLVSDEVGI